MQGAGSENHKDKVLVSFREVDKLGRIIIPKAIRDDAGWEGGDMISSHMENGMIVLRKFGEENNS